jgi:hypothetical protein
LNTDALGTLYGRIRANFGNALADATHTTETANLVGGTNAVTSNVWTHILVSLDATNTDSATKNGAIYVNGVVSGQGGAYKDATAFVANFSNAAGWFLTNSPTAGTHSLGRFDIAEVYINYSESILNPGTSVISAANIAKFYNAGSPVDLGAKGELPTGRTPQIYFSGDKTAFGVNKGTVVNGASQASGLFKLPISDNIHTDFEDAAYGPGSPLPAGQAFIEWATSKPLAAGTSDATEANGGIVAAGDLMVIAIAVIDTSNTTGTHLPFTPPAGFNVDYSVWTNATNTPMTVGVFSKIAVAGDTMQGLAVAWTTANTRGGSLTSIVIKGAAASGYMEAIAGTINGAAASVSPVVAPTISPAGASDLLVTLALIWDSATKLLSVPAGQALRLTGNISAAAVKISTKQLSAAGPTGTSSSNVFTTAGVASTTRGVCVNMAIKPA